MGYSNIVIYAIVLVFLLRNQEISAESGYTEKPSEASSTESNPLATLLADKNEIENVSDSNRRADQVLSRAKRQYPYYYRRYPPIPIIFGGGFGFGPGVGFGPGYGGRGFGGRGFGGRGGGFGGRGGGFGGGGRGGRG